MAVASAPGYQDALCGSVLCGESQSVMLLVSDSATAGNQSIDEVLVLPEASAHTLRIRFLGGTSAISPETRTRALLNLGWLN